MRGKTIRSRLTQPLHPDIMEKRAIKRIWRFIPMKNPLRRWMVPAALSASIFVLALSPQTAAAGPGAFEEFPQKNAWTRITPSIVWCGDESSTVTVEVHIVGRDDVRKAWGVGRNA